MIVKIPTWLHLELQENPASASDAGNEADDTSDHSDGGNQESSDAQLRRPTSGMQTWTPILLIFTVIKCNLVRNKVSCKFLYFVVDRITSEGSY